MEIIKPTQEATHTVPSNMGGTFCVYVDKYDDKKEMAKVVVVNKHSDFHGWTFWEPISNLKRIS